MRLHRIDGGGREHPRAFRLPGPLYLACARVERIERVGPVAEDDLFVADIGLALHESGDAVACPNQLPTAYLQCPEDMVGGADIRDAFMDDGRSQDRFVAAVAPAELAVLERKAVNVPVGGTDDHPVLPDSGCREDLAFGRETPDLTARAAVERLHGTGFIGIQHKLPGRDGGAADVTLILAAPDFGDLGEFPVHAEFYERIVEREPVGVVAARGPVGFVLRRVGELLGVPGFAGKGSDRVPFLVDQDALAGGKYAVGDVDDIVSHFLATVGRTAQDARDALIVQRPVLVPVPADQQLDVPLLQGVHHLEIVEDGGILRIMVHKNDGLILRRGRHDRIEPHQTLVRQQGRRHPHVGTAVAAQELDAACIEFELFITIHPGEGVAAALRPFGVVVARYDPIGMFQPVEHLFGHRNLGVGAEFSDVAAEKGELDVGLAVDVGDATQQVVNAW